MNHRILLCCSPLLLAGCFGKTAVCSGQDADASLHHAFQEQVAALMARDYANLDTPLRASVNLIAASFSGVSETGRDDARGSCTGEAIVTVSLDPVVARQLKDPMAAQWLPTVLGDVTVADDTLRDKLEFTVAPDGDGKPAVQAPGLGDVVSAAVTLTMQRAAASSAGAR